MQCISKNAKQDADAEQCKTLKKKKREEKRRRREADRENRDNLHANT